MAYGIAQVVDSLDSLENMLKSLAGAKQLAIDGEGISLGRTGKLCLLSICPTPPPDNPPDTPPPVFLLDVSTLSSAAFSHTPGPTSTTSTLRGFRSTSQSAGLSASVRGGVADGVGGSEAGAGAPASGQPRSLKEMLECDEVTKLFYDVRCDSEALFHQFRVRLRGVVDLQLSEVAYRRYGPAVHRVNYVLGLSRALELYLDPVVRQRWQATAVSKRALHEVFQRDPEYWDRRPLTEEQVRYAADDVLYLHHLYRELRAALPLPIQERVALFSESRVAESLLTKYTGGNDPTRAHAPPGL